MIRSWQLKSDTWAVFALTVVSSTVVFPTVAAAVKPTAVVVRSEDEQSDVSAGLVSHFLQMAVRDDASRQVIDLDVQLGAPSNERAMRSHAVAVEQLGKARDAFDTLKLDAAIDWLNKALKKFERNGAMLRNMTPLMDTLMLLGASHTLCNKEAVATKFFARALVLRPDIEPDTRIFNPVMQKVFDEAKRLSLKRPRGKLLVTCNNPSDGEVYLDGVFVGITPVVLDNVPEGRHFLRVSQAGFSAWEETLDLAGATETARVAKLLPTRHLGEFDGLADRALAVLADKADAQSFPPAAVELGGLLDADEIILARVGRVGESTEIVTALIDVVNRRRLALTRETWVLPADVTSGPKVAKIYAELQKAANDKPNQTGKEKPPVVVIGPPVAEGCWQPSCPGFSEFKLIVGTGAGALLAATGGLLEYLAYSDNEDFRNTAQISTQVPKLASSGQTKAAVGDLLVAVGVVAAVTSLVLYLVWEPETSTAVASENETSWGLSMAPSSRGATVGAQVTF